MQNKILILIGLYFIFTPVKALSNEATTSINYYKTTCKNDNNICITTVITKKEYDEATQIVTQSTGVETEYKKMYLTNIGNIIKLDVEWKKTPKFKSYDVIALYSEDVIFESSTIIGSQQYFLNNNLSIIKYNRASDNLKLFSNGIGITMNLVDNGTGHHLSLLSSYHKKIESANIYGSYRHSQSNISLNKSQKYELSLDDTKDIIKFDRTVVSYYDNMTAVNIKV